MRKKIRYRNRETDSIESEALFAQDGLRFLYENPFGRLLTTLVLQHPAASHLYGSLQRKPGSRDRIKDFIRRLRIDASEAEHPWKSYQTLDAFFTRKLKPESRPIDRTLEHLVSPADGRVLVYLSVGREGVLVKGARLTLRELLGDVQAARRYQDGSAIVVRLAPADYHRFHFPDSGTAAAPRTIGRGLHSVHPIALQSGAAIFRNKRMVTRLESRNFGELLLVEIGALFVGSILQTYQPGPVERGQEKGYFRFGGSTVVLLARAGSIVLDHDLLEASQQDLETLVRFGTRIARRA